MKPNRSIPTATVIPCPIYPDVREAVAWLTAAFGFVERLQIGEDHRSQLSFGDGARDRRRRPPRPAAAAAGRVDALGARARRGREGPLRARAGARREILMEPTDFEYGERQYAAADPAGHQWTFSETLDDVDPASWGGTLHVPG